MFALTGNLSRSREQMTKLKTLSKYTIARKPKYLDQFSKNESIRCVKTKKLICLSIRFELQRKPKML